MENTFAFIQTLKRLKKTLICLTLSRPYVDASFLNNVTAIIVFTNTFF